MNRGEWRNRSVRIVTSFVLSLLGVVAGAFSAGAAEAQDTTTVDHVAADADVNTLFRRAEAFASKPSRWYEAALLYQISARLRDEGDPEAVHSLRRSAQLLFSLEKYALAGEALEAAGEAALRAGDTYQAAESYLDAMWAADARGASAEAQRLEGVARQLAASDRLTPAQRESLLERLQRTGRPN